MSKNFGCQAPKLIKQNGSFLNNIFNGVQDGLSILGTDLTILMTNQWMEKMYKHRLPLCGKKCYSAYQERKTPCSWCPALKSLKSGKKEVAVVPFPSEKNQKGWIEVTASPIRDENDKIVGIVEYVRDMTERKNIENELKHSKERYKTIFNATPNVIVVLNEKGEIVSGNKQITNWTGLKIEKIIGKNILNIGIFPPESKAKIISALKAKFSGKKIAPYELEFFDKKGERRVCEVRGTIISGASKNSFYDLVVISDITDRKKTDTALYEKEQRLRNIIEHSREIFYIHNTKHVFSYVSPQSKNILGYAPEEMMRKWTDFVTDNPINKEGFRLTQLAIKTGKRQKIYPLEFKKKNGELAILEIDESPLKDENGKVIGITGALRDITDEVKAREKIAESQRLLEFAVRQSPVPIIIARAPDVAIQYYNEEAAKMFAQKPTDIKSIKLEKHRKFWPTFYPDGPIKCPTFL